VGIATHDEKLVGKALHLIDKLALKQDQYEFQMLLGVDHELRRIIVENGHRLRVYVPFGTEWFGYSTRRLKENPAVAGHIIRSTLDRWVGRKV
jgi:proline dehydrogenase